MHGEKEVLLSDGSFELAVAAMLLLQKTGYIMQLM